MKIERIILTLFFGFIGIGLIFYFKPFEPLDKSASIDKIVVTKKNVDWSLGYIVMADNELMNYMKI